MATKTESQPIEEPKAVMVRPDTAEEYEEIKTAADREKRSLAAFCLFHALEAARATNAND